MWFKFRRKSLLIFAILLVCVLNLIIVLYQQWRIFEKTKIPIGLKRKLIKQLDFVFKNGGPIIIDKNDSIHDLKHKPKSKRKISPTWMEETWVPSLRGHLNVHIWLDWCGSTVSDLRRNIHFPKFPDIRVKTPIFYLTHEARNYGQRVFGYLHPPKTGFYKFAVSSDDASELWLSTNADPTNARLIAWVGDRHDPLWSEGTSSQQFHKYPSQISQKLFLRNDIRYFVEALHKQSYTDNHLLVAWQIPGKHNFSYITSSRISLYNGLHKYDVTQLSRYIPLTPATLEPALEILSLRETIRDDQQNWTDLRQTVAQNIKAIAPSIFPSCHYLPSYVADFKIFRFEGVNLIHETAVYPYDSTNLVHMAPYKVFSENRKVDSHGIIIYGKDDPYYNGYYETLYNRDTENNERYKKISGPLHPGYTQDDRKNLEATISNILVYLGKQKTKLHHKNPRTVSVLRNSKNISQKYPLPSNVGDISRSQEKSDNGYQNAYQRQRKKMSETVKKGFLKNGRRITGDWEEKSSQENKTKATKQMKHSFKDNSSYTGIAMDQERDTSFREKDNYKRSETRSKEEQLRYMDRTNGVQFGTADPIEVTPTSFKNYSRKKAETYLGDDWSSRSVNLRIIKLALMKLKASGDWEPMIKYAKEKDLIITKKTLRYVIWKYLHHKKPERDKIVGYLYKQNSLPTGRIHGNLLLNKDVAKSVILKYLVSLRENYSRDIQLKHIVNVEENHDVLYGDRYFIELDIKLNNTGEIARFSDYVYLPLGATSLCYPKNFIWKKTATVHVIVPIKDQGKWVQHFINDMSELYEKTLDPNMNIIIVDFNSSDIDIEKAFARSSLKRYQVLKVDGSFQRALGIQMGANAVEDPNDILFTCDLHLEIPNNLINTIRKHCIQGKMAFSPMVLRLDCGFTPSLPYGEWETMGYGLFAVYKSDFVKIGGMNHEEFTTKWGGEDWEMVDRFLQAGMEIERLRVPQFFHYYHSKSGLWGSFYEEEILTNDFNIVNEDQIVPPYDPTTDPMARYRSNIPLAPQMRGD